MTADNEQHDYDEWLKHKGELDPEDQRYTWPGPKSRLPVLYKSVVVLVMLLAIIVLEVIAIWRMGR